MTKHRVIPSLPPNAGRLGNWPALLAHRAQKRNHARRNPVSTEVLRVTEASEQRVTEAGDNRAIN